VHQISGTCLTYPNGTIGRQLILLTCAGRYLARIDLRKQKSELFGLEIGTRLIKKRFSEKGTEVASNECYKQQLEKRKQKTRRKGNQRIYLKRNVGYGILCWS
jgi:hypothetical protein